MSFDIVYLTYNNDCSYKILITTMLHSANFSNACGIGGNQVILRDIANKQIILNLNDSCIFVLLY